MINVGWYVCCVDLQSRFTNSGGNSLAILEERDICDGRVPSSGRADQGGVLVLTILLQCEQWALCNRKKPVMRYLVVIYIIRLSCSFYNIV